VPVRLSDNSHVYSAHISMEIVSDKIRIVILQLLLQLQI